MKRGKLSLSVQYATTAGDMPERSRVRSLLHSTLPAGGNVAVRFVDLAEGKSLNKRYRKKHHATNVLSFPYQQDGGILGDIIICAPVAQQEAKQNNRRTEDHVAHLIVHGALHLKGYLHDNDDNAACMENAECSVLRRFGVKNPYCVS